MEIGTITTRTVVIGYPSGDITATETVEVVSRFNDKMVIVKILESTDEGSRIGELGYMEG